MTDKKLIHVSLDGWLRDEEMQEISEQFAEINEDLGGDYKFILTDNSMDLGEIPALDGYADELAKRIADELSGGSENERN